jgi:glycosyltransferase involved in cell wall biosynthesis
VFAELNAILPVYSFGRINEQHKLAQIYSAADLFVITSIIDNFPNVVLESLACGTPAAGFRVGGIPDMILPGRTGILVDLGDTAAMAAQISDLFRNTSRLEQMRLDCREYAVQNLSLHIQASQYLELYQELIHDKQGVTN